MSLTRPLVLFKIYPNLDMETNIQTFSNITIQRPDTSVVEGRVLSFGSVDRSIPVPSGLCQTGEASAKLADTDQTLRQLAAPTAGQDTLMGRLCAINIMQAGDSESVFSTCYIGEITGATFEPGSVTVQLRDIHQRWLDHMVPPLISRAHSDSSGVAVDSAGSDLIPFVHLPPGIDEVFAPFIFGNCLSTEDTPQGVIPLKLVDTELNRYIVARHFCWDVIAVYQKLSGDASFSLVDSADYSIVEEVVATLDGVEYTFTYVEFTEAQPDNAELRADVIGLDNRIGFGPLPAVDPGTVQLENPVDPLIQLVYYATLHSPGVARYAINADSWIDVRDKCDALGYKIAGAVTESMTWRALLTQITGSFGIDFYQDKTAHLALGLTTDSDPDRPEFTDILHILRDSTEQKLADPTFNRIRYRFSHNPASDQWQSDVFNNEADRQALGEIQETPFDLFFVRDPDVARTVITDRSRWLALSCFQFECDMPAPEVIDRLELGMFIGVTHYGGIREGGYANEEFKVCGLTLDLDHLKMRVKAIRPAPVCTPLPAEGEVSERTFLLIVI